MYETKELYQNYPNLIRVFFYFYSLLDTRIYIQQKKAKIESEMFFFKNGFAKPNMKEGAHVQKNEYVLKTFMEQWQAWQNCEEAGE